MHMIIFTTLHVGLSKITRPAEAPCLQGSPTFPEGWSFWDKQALLFKDSWAEISFTLNKTRDWNQSSRYQKNFSLDGCWLCDYQHM